jgi:hypothetical protein
MVFFASARVFVVELMLRMIVMLVRPGQVKKYAWYGFLR